MHSNLRWFYAIFRKNFVLYVRVYTPFPVLHMGTVLFCVLKVFGPFYLYFDPNWVYFDSPRMALSCYTCPRKTKHKNVETERTTNPRCPHFSKAFCFLATFQTPSSFNAIISRSCSTSRGFAKKRVVCNLISTSTIPFSSLQVYQLDWDFRKKDWMEVKICKDFISGLQSMDSSVLIGWAFIFSSLLFSCLITFGFMFL